MSYNIDKELGDFMEKKKKRKKKKEKMNKKVTQTIKGQKKLDIKENKKKRVDKKNKRKIIFNIIISLFIVTTLISLVFLYFKKNDEAKTEEEIKESIIPKKDETQSPSEPSKEIKDEISELKEKYNNDDITAILTISDSNFSIPIVKGKDNDYYLSHSISKNKSAIGSVFIDYRNSTDSKQINIYGHNSESYSPPFKILENYLRKSYFNNHQYIELKIENEIRKYEIFSVYISSKSSKEEHMHFDYASSNEWLNHYKRIQERSLYNANNSVDENDNIIILQTCVYNEYKGKLLIIAAKEIKSI